MTDLKGRKPILCLDFDGVCHSYVSGWKGAAVIPDPPVPGLYEFLLAADKHFEVNIFSSRSNQEGGIDAMQRWFQDHRPCDDWIGNVDDEIGAMLKRLQFPIEKPPAFIGIDDRVIQFNGEWPSIEELKQFKTWNAKGV